MILFVLGINGIDAWATTLYANGGEFHPGITQQYVVESATLSGPSRNDGAEFIGYLQTQYNCWLITENRDYPELWDAIYSYKHGISKQIKYTVYWTTEHQDNIRVVERNSMDVSIDTGTGKISFSNHKIHVKTYSTYNTGLLLDEYDTTESKNILDFKNSAVPNLGSILAGEAKWLRFPWERVGDDPDLIIGAIYSKKLGYKITFNVNGGSTSISSQTVSTINLPNPGTKTGYTFAGWYNGNTRIGGVGDKWTPTADATITAKWTPVTYSISYAMNGGTNNSGNPSTYTIETNTITLKDPTRTGYTFAGWYSNANFSTKVTTINKGSTGNKTFYAKWTPRTDTKYVVRHQIMNVSGSGYTLKETENLKGTTDASVTPNTKSYTGFTAPAKQTVPINADGSRVVTYSYTRNKYTATFNGNGGTVSKGSASLYYEAALGTLPTAERAGYTFKGWYTALNGGTQVSSSTKLMGNTTYYAQWTPITYTITYKLNGGKVDYKKVKYNIETPTFYIENPTKKGFTFTGWTGTGISTATTDLSVPLGSYGNKTFEATWGNGIYTINFDGNGATSGSMDSITVKAGESVKLPENSFEREGYSFVGWYTTKEDRFGTFYKNGATVEDLTESITLHAQWRKDRGIHEHNDNTGSNGDNGNGSGDGNNDGLNTGDNGSGNGNNSGPNTGDNGSGNNNGSNTVNEDNGNNDGLNNNSDSGNGEIPSDSDTENGNNGSTGGSTSGSSGNDSGNGGRPSGGNGNNRPVMTPSDEIGYFGTGTRKNEISILTSLGLNDNKLTLNYNY